MRWQQCVHFMTFMWLSLLAVTVQSFLRNTLLSFQLLSFLVCYQAWWSTTQMYVNFIQLVIYCILSPIMLFVVVSDTSNIRKPLWTNFEPINISFGINNLIGRKLTKLKSNLTKLVVPIIIFTYLGATRIWKIKQDKELCYQKLMYKQIKYISNHTCKRWMGVSRNRL